MQRSLHKEVWILSPVCVYNECESSCKYTSVKSSLEMRGGGGGGGERKMKRGRERARE